MFETKIIRLKKRIFIFLKLIFYHKFVIENGLDKVKNNNIQICPKKYTERKKRNMTLNVYDKNKKKLNE